MSHSATKTLYLSSRVILGDVSFSPSCCLKYLIYISFRLSFSQSVLAMDRLAVQGICRIHNCGGKFDSGAAYRFHLHDVHVVSHSKNNTDQVLCPWAGCGRYQSKGSLWNHLLAHGVQAGCGVCDMKLSPRSDTVQKHYRICHKEAYKELMISSAELGNFAYLFFSGDGIAWFYYYFYIYYNGCHIITFSLSFHQSLYRYLSHMYCTSYLRILSLYYASHFCYLNHILGSLQIAYV